MKRILYKIIRNTNLWRKGQKVWHIFGTGEPSSFVIGKYKNKGRWIKGWIHFIPKLYISDCLCRPNAKEIGIVKINKKFNNYLERLSGE